MLFFGLNDVLKKFLVQTGHGRVQMISQIVSTFIHVLMNYQFVNRLQMGVVGSAVATCFTNAFLLTINIFQTSRIESLREAISVSILDKRVGGKYKEYLQICLPNMFVIFLDWSRNELVVLMTGELGVI